MRNTDTFRQYIWLVNTIYRSKRISRKHIEHLWIEDDLNDRRPLTRPTFIRLKEAVENMFGIIIECERKNGYQYYISNPEVLKNNSTPTWMLQTLTVNNVLIDSLSIKDRLVLEEIPEGMEHLQTIIKAIKNNHVLSVGYQKFNDPKGYSTTIEPYCLKVFRQRWYLLGNNTTNKKELQIYALDRITHLEETSKTFELDPDFNASEFFKNYFGVFIGEEREPVRIVLRAYGKMIPLLRTLPKHHSQKEISTEKDYSDFEYLMAPTFDFKQEILKEGPDWEVLEPSSLRSDIIASLMETTHRYQQ